MLDICRLLPVLSCLLLVPALAHAQLAPVSISGPVAPVLEDDGQGMCMASAIVERDQDGRPEIPFGTLDKTNYNPTLNSFLEQRRDARVEYVVRTLLDLSNNNLADPQDQTSLGDFRDVQAGCPAGGCDFFIRDTSTSFVSRLRGFLNVPAELANQALHIGFYTDDAVSLSIYDKDANLYEVMNRPPIIGSPTWRLSRTVEFQEPGLYPVEILYTAITEHAALEMSYFVGAFQDFEREAAQEPVVQLDDAGFTPFEPARFFQAISGAPSFEDPDLCLQCNRQFVGQPGNNGCPGGYYCNEAALCAPCDTALYCGPSCSPCGGTTPFCINLNGRHECVECREDTDCQPGYQCNQDTNTCFECNKDEDCERGEYCDLSEGVCTTCDSSDQCAGSSCNCCPTGSNGLQMQCAPVAPAGPPVCAECLTDAECPGGVCDLTTGHCAKVLEPNRSPAACGPERKPCPEGRPYCIPGPLGAACFECRWDLDCPDGNYCNSGLCEPCTQDRRCGLRCTSCGGDTPYCLNRELAALSLCVGCVDDTQCENGVCNPETYQCDPVCMLSCAEGTRCHGDECVECYADTHCPCGGSCDTDTFTCTSSCKSNKDCLGNEHCRLVDEDTTECAAGPMPSDVLCARPLASGCEGRVGSGRPASPWAMLGLLLGAVMLVVRYRRSRRYRPRRDPGAQEDE